MAKIAYNANGLRTLDIRDAVQEVRNAGYEGIELSLSPNHLDIFSITSAEAFDLGAFIRDCGILPCCLATGYDALLSPERFEPSLIHPDAGGRELRLDLLRRSTDLARQLGVPVLNFGSGFLRPGVAANAARDHLLEGVSECLKYAGGEVTLAIEPEPGFFIETNSQALQLIRQVGSTHFRLNQDIGHVNVCEDNYLASIADALALTAHIHIEDIRNRVHRHEIPGEGDIDFYALSEILNNGSFDGFVSVELYNHAEIYESALYRSLNYLRATGVATALVSSNEVIHDSHL